MFRRISRRLGTLLLSATLLTSSASMAAAAGGFATAPIEDRAIAPDPGVERDLPRPTPRFNETTRARLRAVLAKRRGKNVAAFRAYAVKGVYPRNDFTIGALNVWIDKEGHMCAAATMMFSSGARSLVRKAAEQNNFIKLADVTDGPLLDWILTSGLTHAEVVAIQQPMVGGPEQNEEMMRAFRIAQDKRLRGIYDTVYADLVENRTASLEAAIDALTLRPDLVAELLRA
jgi:hypothetical protein